MRPDRAISGHVFRVDGKRRPMWRAKYRLPDGRQVQRTIGKVWTERGRPPEGYFTKRTAEAWLRDVLDQAERGTLPGMVRTGRTFANAADEYLRYLTDDRQRKPSTVRDARSVIANHLLPPFGPRRLEDITEPEVDRWAQRLGTDRPLSNATKRKILVIFHGVMARACRRRARPRRARTGVTRRSESRLRGIWSRTMGLTPDSYMDSSVWLIGGDGCDAAKYGA
jgi:integrase